MSVDDPVGTRPEAVDPVPLAQPALDERERERVAEVVSTGQLSAGETVGTFEEQFADFCGTAEAVATANGTAALHTALRALDIGAGDRVLTTPFSFVATANAIRLAGAEPVFADIDYETYNLDPHAVEATVREHDGDIDALLAVHLYGLPAPMAHLADVADTYDMALIEDAAQAHGAKHEDSRVGSIGDVGCFSFYPTKNMTTGEGGIVTTDREDVAQRARQFVDHGRNGEGRHEVLGHNFRMTDLAAALGVVQLQKLRRFNRARRAHAHRLTEGLAETSVITPSEPAESRHVYHQYTVRTPDRDAVREALADAGIETGVYYPRPIHQEPAYDHVDTSLPVAERAAQEVLSLPVHPRLSTTQVDHVVDTIRRFFRERTGGAASELATDGARGSHD
jgi:perosamine synthetase